MIDLKWLLSEQKKYMKENLLAYEFTSVPFAIILGEKHEDNEERELENNVIAKFLPEYILVEPSMGAWIFDPNKNQAQLRDDEPFDCSDDLEDMQKFLKLDINENSTEPQEAFQSFQNYNGADIFLDERDFKLWSIKYKIPLVGCDLGSHEMLGVPAPSDEAREKKMGEIMSMYAKKSSKPIIAIVGHTHAASVRIHAILRQKEVGYLILTRIDP